MRRLPVKLFPAAKDYLWGGNRLNDDFAFDIPMSPFAEAWVCSTHPDGVSLISQGNTLLSELLQAHPNYLGTHTLLITNGKPELPILIKLIDAKQDLSVQVHPDDDYAREKEGQLGKTEMWYVLDARPDMELIYGFRQDTTAEDVREALVGNTIEKLLNHVPVHGNDLFFIEAGTVHAIGAGALIAEIQENSNLTYRLYDYGRSGKDGKPRPLHIEKALDVANLHSSISPRQPLRTLRYRKGCAHELLTRCRYFQVERMLLNTATNRDLVTYQTEENSFHALLCIDGCGSISAEDYMENFFKGDCFFIPANSESLKIHGKAEFLDISC